MSLPDFAPSKVRRFPKAFVTAVLVLTGTSSRADELRILVRHTDQPRAVIARQEDESLLLPLFACGPLLDAEVRWDKLTNRWSIKGRKASARGFLDEPLLIVAEKPLLVRHPPRLLDGKPYMSLNALALLGRHVWETEFIWNEETEELTVRPIALTSVQTVERTRAISVPATPPGSRVIVLDAGHPRRGGVRGAGGLAEGDLGLKLARAVSSTLSRVPGLSCVILQGEKEGLQPSEVSSLANALKAEVVVSFHASPYGEPGIALWCWATENIIRTGVEFRPFEEERAAARTGSGPAAGPITWPAAAGKHFEDSLALSLNLIAELKDSGVPIRGPHLAPLLSLEGLSCPAFVVDCQGIATSPGAALARQEATTLAIASGIARAILTRISPETEAP